MSTFRVCRCLPLVVKVRLSTHRIRAALRRHSSKAIEVYMHELIYLVGLVVVVLFILGFLGLR
jgi:hypothetical protein